MNHPFFLIAIAMVLIGLVFFLRKGGMAKLPKVIENAKSAQSPVPIIQYIREQPMDHREDLWDQALSELWGSYDRELAAQVLYQALKPTEKVVVSDPLTPTFAGFSKSPDADIMILHYWLTQVLQVEPEIAQQTYSQEFLTYAYNPELARCCGKGCCG